MSLIEHCAVVFDVTIYEGSRGSYLEGFGLVVHAEKLRFGRYIAEIEGG